MNELNRRAFLDLIAFSEGTYGKGDNGYNVLVGGELFDSYVDHPRKVITIKMKGQVIRSSAAGRYQILKRYYDAYAAQLGLKNFSPAAQDAIALQMIKEQKALESIDAGNIPEAIKRCANIWASLPGAGYGQHENKLETLLAKYKEFVGVEHG